MFLPKRPEDTEHLPDGTGGNNIPPFAKLSTLQNVTGSVQDAIPMYPQLFAVGEDLMTKGIAKHRDKKYTADEKAPFVNPTFSNKFRKLDPSRIYQGVVFFLFDGTETRASQQRDVDLIAAVNRENSKHTPGTSARNNYLSSELKKSLLEREGIYAKKDMLTSMVMKFPDIQVKYPTTKIHYKGLSKTVRAGIPSDYDINITFRENFAEGVASTWFSLYGGNLKNKSVRNYCFDMIFCPLKATTEPSAIYFFKHCTLNALTTNGLDYSATTMRSVTAAINALVFAPITSDAALLKELQERSRADAKITTEILGTLKYLKEVVIGKPIMVANTVANVTQLRTAYQK